MEDEEEGGLEVFEGNSNRTGRGSAKVFCYARWDKHITMADTKKPFCSSSR